MPIFRILAKPGIGNPHTPYETELMLAGVKPVAILKASEVQAKLSDSISNGQIITIGQKEFDYTQKLYFLPEYKKQASKAADIYTRSFNSQKISNLEESFLSSFIESKTMLENRSKKISFMRNKTPEQKLLDREITSLAPIHMMDVVNYKDLQKAENTGVLNTLTIPSKNIVTVVAQHNNEAEGKELFARYFCDSDGYDPINNDMELNARIGCLLGYTQNDIDWSNGTKYKNPLVRKALYTTDYIRTFARKEYLIQQSRGVSLDI